MKTIRNLLCLAALALAAFVSFPASKVEAQQQPCQWNYSIVNGVATASYCGNVTAAGSIVPSVGQKNLLFYGALCDGVNDDSAAILASLAAQNSAIAPAALICMVNPAGLNGITVAANQLITAEPGGGYIGGPTQNQIFNLTGSYAGVTNALIKLNGGHQSIVVRATEAAPITAPYILNVTYSGQGQSGSTYEYWLGDSDGVHTQFGAGIINGLSVNNTQNQLDNSNVSHNFIFESVRDGQAIGNRCLNDSGFCIETRWTYGMTLNGNQGIGVNYGGTATAVGTTVPFTTTAPVSHCSVINNNTGAVVALTVTGCANVGTNPTITGATNGVSYTLVAYRALEAFIVNSDSYYTTMIGNTAKDRGDNGITMGTDYHCNGSTCTLGGGTLADASAGNVFIGNVIDGVALAGIANDSFCTDMTAYGNNISNYGLGIVWGTAQDAFSAALVNTYTTQQIQCKTHWGSNNINNPRNLARWGVSINGFPNSLGTAEQLINIADQNFTGTFVQEYYTPFSGSLGVCTIRRVDQPVIAMPAQPDFDTSFGAGTNPVNTAFWTYVPTGTGWTQSAAIKQGGTNSVQTTANASVDMVPSSESSTSSQMAPNGIAVFKIWAKSSGAATGATASYIQLFARNGGAGVPLCGPFPITNTAWALYEFSASYQGQQAMYSIRIGEPAGGVSANFQYPWLGRQSIQ